MKVINASVIRKEYYAREKKYKKNPRCQYCGLHSCKGWRTSTTIKNAKICVSCRSAEKNGTNLKKDTRHCINNRCKFRWPRNLPKIPSVELQKETTKIPKKKVTRKKRGRKKPKKKSTRKKSRKKQTKKRDMVKKEKFSLSSDEEFLSKKEFRVDDDVDDLQIGTIPVRLTADEMVNFQIGEYQSKAEMLRKEMNQLLPMYMLYRWKERELKSILKKKMNLEKKRALNTF